MASSHRPSPGLSTELRMCLRKVGPGKPMATEKDNEDIGWGWEENTLDRYQRSLCGLGVAGPQV